MHDSLVKGSLTGLLAKGTFALGSLLIIPLMLKQIGNKDYGIWITISSSISLMSFMDFGIGNNLLNYLAKANTEKKEIIRLINLAYFLQILCIGALCILFASIFKFINWNAIFNLKNNSPEILKVIFITFILFFFSLITNTIYSIERGLLKSHIANLWQLISSIFYLVCLWITLLINPSLLAVAIVSVGIPVLIGVINTVWFLSRGKLLNANLKNFSFRGSRAFISNSAGFLYLQLAALIAFQTDALVVAHILDFEEVSKYYVCTRIFFIPTLVIGVYLQTLWPIYAEASVKGNWQWIKITFYKGILWTFLPVIIFVLTIFIFKVEIFGYWLKSRINIPDSLILACAAWTVINNCLDLHIATLLNGLNILKIQAISAFFMVISNILLSIFLTQRIGVAGVVWGTAISTLIFSSIPLLFFTKSILKKKLNVNSI